jgi:hypothetical protein
MKQNSKSTTAIGITNRLEQLQVTVSIEYVEYKRTLCAMSVGHVFQQAHHIHLVEEVTFVIRDCPEEIEEDETVLDVLEQLAAEKRILAAFLDWADDDDYVNISNAEATIETLQVFCAWWRKEQKGGSAE